MRVEGPPLLYAMTTLNVHQQLLQDAVTASGHVETCCLIRVKKGTVKASCVGFEVCELNTVEVVSTLGRTNFDVRTQERTNGAVFFTALPGTSGRTDRRV